MTRTTALKLWLALILIFLVHISAIHFYWYWFFWWLDIPMHFLAALWVGIVTLLVFAQGESRTRALLYSLGATIVVGILWELYEYASGMTFALMAYPLDTATDMAMDVVGGAAAYFLLRDRIGTNNHIE